MSDNDMLAFQLMDARAELAQKDWRIAYWKEMAGRLGARVRQLEAFNATLRQALSGLINIYRHDLTAPYPRELAAARAAMAQTKREERPDDH